MSSRVAGPHVEGTQQVLTLPALGFVEDLTRRFRPGIEDLLAKRRSARERAHAGGRPDFLAATSNIRSGDWKVGPIPRDLQDRRVEITGPVDRKMIINALNSGAQVFMADFEDATSPTWANLVAGQVNLMDAVRRTISYVQPDSGKRYALNPARGSDSSFRSGSLRNHQFRDARLLPGVFFLSGGRCRQTLRRHPT